MPFRIEQVGLRSWNVDNAGQILSSPSEMTKQYSWEDRYNVIKNDAQRRECKSKKFHLEEAIAHADGRKTNRGSRTTCIG